MMSALEGGGGSWKSGCSEGGCVNFILQISSKCRQGGGGQKITKLLQTSFKYGPPSQIELLMLAPSLRVCQKSWPRRPACVRHSVSPVSKKRQTDGQTENLANEHLIGSAASQH